MANASRKCDRKLLLQLCYTSLFIMAGLLAIGLVCGFILHRQSTVEDVRCIPSSFRQTYQDDVGMPGDSLINRKLVRVPRRDAFVDGNIIHCDAVATELDLLNQRALELVQIIEKVDRYFSSYCDNDSVVRLSIVHHYLLRVIQERVASIEENIEILESIRESFIPKVRRRPSIN